ncbi:MAG: TolC family protein [Campylobacterota bacterium]|nr:TolC family protein [Campylobacterota bacterium]
MKVLMPLIVLLTLCNNLLAKDEDNNTLDVYISDYKKEQFGYDYKKVQQESLKLRDSWISPVRLNYNYQNSNPYDKEQKSQTASVIMDQTVFASGGIYYAIKFAEASQKYSNYSVDVAKRKLVKDAVSLLMQIKQMDLKVKKQNLQIKNSEINLQQKTELYINGQIDSGFLDNAVIERNIVIQTLYDIQTNKERLISRFNAISDMDYRDAYIPHLELLSRENFLKHNIVLSMSKSNIEKTKYSKDVTVAKYLPHLNVVAGYNWSKADNQQFGNTGAGFSGETDYYNYGLKATMPLDINTFRDIEASRVDYLKSQAVIKDTKRELIAIYEQVMQNIKNFEKKSALSQENTQIYEKLLSETDDMYSAGYKTKYDVSLLSNSINIQNLDTKIFEIDAQLELLTLYEMYKNDKK